MAGASKKKPEDKTKPVCQYGSKCYRKNPQHIQNYTHPGRDDEDKKTEDVSTPGNIKPEKKRKAATIETYFGKATRSHAVSDSDSEEGSTDQPAKKKRVETNVESEPVTEDGGSSTEHADVDVTSKESAEQNEDVTSKESTEQNEENPEHEDSPASPEDVKENIKHKFLVDMPDDFYQFWEFCQSLKPGNPTRALEESLNLVLVGPFHILSGRHKHIRKNKLGRRPNFLLHYRYFFDPPEFQTVLASDEKSKFHLGYYRDDPKQNPVFVASNSPGSSSPEKVYSCGDNLFAAVHIHASKLLKSSSGKTKKSIEQLIKSLEEEARKHKLSLSEMTKGMKDRKKAVVCPTFHGAGIVVPVDSNDVGYRPVPETPSSLRTMLKTICEAKTQSDQGKHMDELQELITLVQFANDECDYGEGLELGLDLFSFGAKVLHPQIASLLPLAYQLLKRPEFSQIITEHLKHRREVTQCVDELAS
ncbi:hypothetical protein BsWGS_27212 [Bradybaena similaris]